MKHPLLPARFLAGVSLSLSLLIPTPRLDAADYILTTGISTTWDNAPWALSPGPGTGVPGVGDHILNLTPEATVNIDLNGDRTIASLKRNSSGTIRFLNSSSDSSLEATESMTFENGTTHFRSDPTHRLTVRTATLVLGSEEEDSSGRIQFGGSANYRNVTFEVSGTTTLTGYNSAIILSSDLTREATAINLGHVVFETSPAARNDNGTPGLVINSGVLTVRSLRNPGSWTRPTVRGTGTLLITGNADDAHQPAGLNNFGLEVQGGVSVEKAGTNLQIFSRSAGNSYSGGTVISGGVLAVQNTTGSGVGTGAVEIRDGGTLAGSGQVRLGEAAITVKAGGLLAPGADGAEGFSHLLINGGAKGASKLVQMESGAAFTFDLDALGGSDSIRFGNYTAGDLLLDAGGIAININGTLSETTYTLFTFNRTAPGESGNTSSGLTGGLLMGTGFDGYSATFHYDEEGFGGTGVISMSVTAIPEPRLAALALPLIAGLLFRGMRRRHAG